MTSNASLGIKSCVVCRGKPKEDCSSCLLHEQVIQTCKSSLNDECKSGSPVKDNIPSPYVMEGKYAILGKQRIVYYPSSVNAKGKPIPYCHFGRMMGGPCSSSGCTFFHDLKERVFVDCRVQKILPSPRVTVCVCESDTCAYHGLQKDVGPFMWDSGHRIPLMINVCMSEDKQQAFTLTDTDLAFILDDLKQGGCGFFLCRETFRATGSSVELDSDKDCCKTFAGRYRDYRVGYHALHGSDLPSVLRVPERVKKPQPEKKSSVHVSTPAQASVQANTRVEASHARVSRDPVSTPVSANTQARAPAAPAAPAHAPAARAHRAPAAPAAPAHAPAARAHRAPAAPAQAPAAPAARAHRAPAAPAQARAQASVQANTRVEAPAVRAPRDPASTPVSANTQARAPAHAPAARAHRAPAAPSSRPQRQ